MYKRLLIVIMGIMLLTGCGQAEETATKDYVQTDDVAEEQEQIRTEVPTEKPTEAPTAVSAEASEEKATAVPAEAPTETPMADPTETLTEAPQEKVLLDKQIIMDESSEVGGHTTENINYAVYPSNIVETNNFDTNQYVWSERAINITFPQIYYSNEYAEYDMDLETKINEQLFWQCMGYDDSFLTGRDTRGLVEYNMDYVITKANENIFSVKYSGWLYPVSAFEEKCNGITIDLRTGEKIDLSEIMEVDGTLTDRVKNNELEYVNDVGYEPEFIVELVEMFVEDYQSGTLDTYSCYFLEDNVVNLIVPMSFGNSNYIILKVPLE